MLALTFVVLAACGRAHPRASAPVDGGAPAAVILVDTSFSPPATTVGIGEVVQWVWKDRREHDVVFDDGPSSPRLRTGVWQRAFDRVGTHKYLCTLHPSMTGHVVVE